MGTSEGGGGGGRKDLWEPGGGFPWVGQDSPPALSPAFLQADSLHGAVSHTALGQADLYNINVALQNTGTHTALWTFFATL